MSDSDFWAGIEEVVNELPSSTVGNEHQLFEKNIKKNDISFTDVMYVIDQAVKQNTNTRTN